MLSQYKSVCNSLKSRPLKHVHSSPLMKCLSTFFCPLKDDKVEKNNITPKNKNPNKMQHCDLLWDRLSLQVKIYRDSCLSPSPSSAPSLHKHINRRI